MLKSTILDVSDGRTRDLLRGLLNQKEDQQLRPTFERLMQNVNAADLPIVDDLLRSSKLFRNLEFREEFPADASTFTDTMCFDIVPKSGSMINYIRHRANVNEDKVASAIMSLSLMNECIFSQDDDAVITSIHNNFINHGHSLSLARKLAFILSIFSRETESWKIASATFSTYGLESRNYGMMAVADTIGDDFSYLSMKSSFAGFASLGSKAGVSRRLAYLSFNPVIFDQQLSLQGLAASYFFSLTDAVLFTLVHRELGVFSQHATFAPEIEKAWNLAKSQPIGLTTFFDDDDAFCDAKAFRASTAFLEVTEFREFRASLQRLYDIPELRKPDAFIATEYENRFFSNVATIKDILPTNYDVYDAVPRRFDRDVSGSLTRSCGLTRLALMNPDFSQINGVQMGHLMGRTAEVDRLLPAQSLRDGYKSANDPFVALILLILLRAHSPSSIDLFTFKSFFQDFVEEECNGSIISFIDLVYSVDKGIVQYLVPLLDETMLSQVPYLVTTAEGVYETRALILEWFARHFDEPTYKDKAKQLRIDRKIASVRGQINETRINIDGLRFRQWVEEAKQPEFSALLRQDSVAAPYVADLQSKRSYSEIKLTAHRDPNARAAVAIMECYKEFCSNGDFGIASYLGRRIRHGTLRGTLLDNLPNPDDYNVSVHVKQQYEKWLENFKELIGKITDMLHFKSKLSSNSAMISPEVDCKEKWDIAMVCLQSVYDKAKVDHGATVIPAVIEQYCWYIFEVELKNIQDTVLDLRSDSTLFKAKTHINDFKALKFEKQVNLVVTNHFNTVVSWFKKPANISPVAEIGNIIEVVKREAQAEFATFNPEISILGGSIKLSGSVYYHVYDALSVVVRNAAKHGRHTGAFRVVATSTTKHDGEYLTINIKSLVKEEDTPSAAMDRIAEAAKGGAIDADVIEGLSGIRKLEKMKSDASIADFCYAPYDDTLVLEAELAFFTKGSVQ